MDRPGSCSGYGSSQAAMNRFELAKPQGGEVALPPALLERAHEANGAVNAPD